MPIRVFRDLHVRGSPEQLARTISAIEALLDDGWTRERDREVEIEARSDKPRYAFKCEGKPPRDAAVSVP